MQHMQANQHVVGQRLVRVFYGKNTQWARFCGHKNLEFLQKNFNFKKKSNQMKGHTYTGLVCLTSAVK